MPIIKKVQQQKLLDFFVKGHYGHLPSALDGLSQLPMDFPTG